VVEELDGASGHLHAVCERVLHRVHPTRECRQQGRVHIENRVGKCAEELVAEDAVVPSADHQLNLCFAQQRDDRTVACCRVVAECALRHRLGRDVGAAGDFQGPRSAAVAQHEHHLGGEVLGIARAQQRLQIRSRPRDQHAQARAPAAHRS
jgi:hypothetical protein